jgi:hypothetical protein
MSREDRRAGAWVSLLSSVSSDWRGIVRRACAVVIYFGYRRFSEICYGKLRVFRSYLQHKGAAHSVLPEINLQSPYGKSFLYRS